MPKGSKRKVLQKGIVQHGNIHTFQAFRMTWSGSNSRILLIMLNLVITGARKRLLVAVTRWTTSSCISEGLL